MAQQGMARPSGFSRHSIRRRVKASVSNMIEVLSSGQPQIDLIDDVSPVPHLVATNLFVDSEWIVDSECQSPDRDCGEALQTVDNDYDDIGGCSVSSGDDDVLQEDSCIDDFNDGNKFIDGHSVPLSIRLAEWAVHFSVSMSALRGLLDVLRPFHAELPSDPRTLLSTPTSYAVREISHQQGHYYHFGIASGIDLNSCLPDGAICLQFNLDGLPLFKSSSVELWPILCLVKGTLPKPFVVGLYCGKKKPVDLDEFLCDFVDDLQNLLLQGIDKNGIHRDVVVDCFVCDAPARAYIKNIKLYSGYSGCDKCVQEGEYIEGKVTFPLTTARLRTDQEFQDMVDEEHHHGPSPLASLGIGMVTNFVFDYMHLVCLGVVRRILNFWLKGPIRKDSILASRLPAKTVSCLSEKLIQLSPFVPRDFVRKPRTVAELDRWKATEFRQFLLYTGPIVLQGILPVTVFNHFMLLSVGISILCSPRFCLEYNSYAHDLLVSFVEMSADIYGPGFLVYNVHGLVHLAADVKKHGNLDGCSAFPFENHLKVLKRLVRKASSPLPQIVRRIGEMRLFKSPAMIKTSVSSTSGKAEHFNGPVPSGFEGAQQFGQLSIDDVFISLEVRDHCIAELNMPPDMYAVVEWIDEDPKQVSVVPQTWMNSANGGKSCYWPPDSIAKKLKRKDFENLQLPKPEENWAEHRVRCLKIVETYGAALKKCTDATITSDLSSAESGVERQKRRERCHVPLSDDSFEVPVTVHCAAKSTSVIAGKKKQSTGVVIPVVPPSLLVRSVQESFAADRAGPPPSTPIAGNNLVCSIATAVTTCMTTSVSCGNVIPQPTIVSDSISSSPCHSFAVQTTCVSTPAMTTSATSTTVTPRMVQSYEPSRSTFRANETSLLQLLLTQNAEMKEQVMFNTKLLQELVKKQRGIDSFTAGMLPKNIRVPLTSRDEVTRIEQQLQSQETYKQLIAYLAVIGGTTIKEATYRVMSALFHQSLSLMCTWQGSKHKFAFESLTLKDVVTEAVRKNPLTSRASNKEVEECIKKWLRNAPDRNGGRLARMKRAAKKASVAKRKSRTNEIHERSLSRSPKNTRRSIASSKVRHHLAHRSRSRSIRSASKLRNETTHDRSRSFSSGNTQTSRSRSKYASHQVRSSMESEHQQETRQWRNETTHCLSRSSSRSKLQAGKSRSKYTSLQMRSSMESEDVRETRQPRKNTARRRSKSSTSSKSQAGKSRSKYASHQSRSSMESKDAREARQPKKCTTHTRSRSLLSGKNHASRSRSTYASHQMRSSLASEDPLDTRQWRNETTHLRSRSSSSSKTQTPRNSSGQYSNSQLRSSLASESETQSRCQVIHGRSRSSARSETSRSSTAQ